MSKTRVYEYAKKYNISSKDVIAKLKEMNVVVSNHMATIEDADLVKLDAIFNKKNSKESQNQAKKEHQHQNSKPKQANPAAKPQVQSKSSAKAYEEDDAPST